MKEEVLYKLNIISLLPWKVTVSSLAIIESQSFPVLKLQVWIDNILLDQTFHLKFNEGIDAAGNRTIHLAEKPFRYFTRQLFSRSKVARLKVKLLRGNWDWTTTEEVETFNLVLSEYSYEFSKSKFNQFQEHLVGVIRGAILHFKIQCEYDDQRSRLSAEEESRPEREIKSTQKQDFIDQMLLPMQSLTVDYAFKDKEDSSSSVFIETQQMKAVYRDEDITNKKLRFKVEGSVMNAGDNDSQFRSIIKETRKLKDSTSTFCTVLFFTYMVLCGVIIVLQMFPKRKF